MTIVEAVETICGYPVHEAAAWLPWIDGPAFEEFVDDIRENGLMEPIVVTPDGVLIDGRNRARACERLGIAPTTTTHVGDILAFILSHNVHRRHLTDSQRAMFAAKLATRAPGHRRAILESTCSYEHVAPSMAEAADLLAVSKSAVQKAKQIHRKGTAALVALVSEGHAPLTTAARVATELPLNEQDAYVEQVRAGADPVKAGPPQTEGQVEAKRRYAAKGKSERPPRPSVMGGNRRKHLGFLEALVTNLEGVVLAFEGIETLDASVTNEEAARLTSDLFKGIRALTRILNLVKERTTP